MNPKHSFVSRSPARRHIALAASLCLLLAACDSKAPADKPAAAGKGGPAVAVVTTPAATQELVRRIALDADVVSLASPNIAAEVAGTLSKILVVPGQAVRKGQVLAEINPADLTLSANDAKAQVAQLITLLADKEKLLARHEKAGPGGVISPATLDTLRAEVGALRQQVEGAKARAALAQNNLAKTQIVAPYAATVSQRNMAAGSFARAGDVLFVLWSPESSSVRVRVPQEYAGKVKPGQKLFLTWAGKEIETSIERVRSDIDSASRSFEAHARVPAELQSATGASLSASLELRSDAALAVPAQAVQLNGPKAFVFVVDAAKKAQQKDVVVGTQVDGQVEIVQGLSAGEQVIVDGAPFVRSGQSVKVEAPVASKAAAR